MTIESKGEDITVNKDGGVLKEIIRASNDLEMPLTGDTVFVHYTGTLLDGTKFDSSRDRGEKFSFEVGKGSVIKGWDLGIPTMKRGELARFTIKSEYAYGENGSPPSIPANATLIFEIELFEFHGEDLSEDKSKSIVRRIIKQGTGYSSPNDGARVVLNLKGIDSNGRVFDERNDVEFEISEGEGKKICTGIEIAIMKFKLGEHSKLSIKSQFAWGTQGCKEFGIGENSDVMYEVELKSFEKAKESWQLNGTEKIDQGELLKNKGAELFKEGKYAAALKKYSKIIDYLSAETYVDEQKEVANKLLLAANLNVAMCNLKLKNYRLAVESCEKALQLDPKNEKGLFRLAQAYFGMNEFQDAMKSFNQVLEINPANKEASREIVILKQKIKENHEREKALYSKMFSK